MKTAQMVNYLGLRYIINLPYKSMNSLKNAQHQESKVSVARHVAERASFSTFYLCTCFAY